MLKENGGVARDVSNLPLSNTTDRRVVTIRQHSNLLKKKKIESAREIYSTVTLLAKFLGLSTSVPRAQAV